MRILHVIPSVSRTYGGPTQSLLGFLLAARAAGIEVEVAAPDPGPDERDWWAKSLPGQHLTLFPSLGAGAFVSSPPLLWWLLRHGERFDLVHIHALQNPISSTAAAACRIRGWPYLIRPLGMLSEFTFTHRRQLAKKLYFRAFDRGNIAASSGIHFTTEGERQEGLRRVHYLGVRAFVVPPPWSGEPTARAPAARPELLFLSRLHPVKNLEALLRAWPQVLRVVPNASLVLAGDGDPGYVSSLHALVRDLGITGSTRFTGFATGDQKHALLASARAFALISFHENFGVAALEAIAAGLPLVLSPTVHIAPLVSAHRLGTAIDPSDSNALAAAVVTALTDIALQGHCATAGPALVQSAFSVETIAAQLLTMYQQACA